jgi:hypothetical protein
VKAASKVLADTITALHNASTAGALNSALLTASYLAVAGTIPTSQSEDITALQLRANSAISVLKKRQSDVTAAIAQASTVADKLEVIRQVFSGSFLYLPRFTPPDAANLLNALNASSNLVGAGSDAPASWFQQLTHLRPGIARLDMALMLAQALAGTARPDFTIGQLPYIAAARWVGLPLSGPPLKPGVVSLVILTSGDYTSSSAFAGIMIDEWPERIPVTEQAAGLTFQYSEPVSRAPQAVLIAVCPDAAKRRYWDDAVIQAILNETLDLAKVRTVDLASVAAVGQVLPMLDFPDNSIDTISLGILEIVEAM